jgi:hypothetical protein
LKAASFYSLFERKLFFSQEETPLFGRETGPCYTNGSEVPLRADGSMPAKLDGIDFLAVGGYANVSGIAKK